MTVDGLSVEGATLEAFEQMFDCFSRDSPTHRRRSPMSRRYADLVEVRRGEGAPQQFLWRKRVYVVRSVLAHWLEAGAWWRSEPARSLLGTGASGAEGQASGEGQERELWRVEAAGGRGVGVGVYDLCREASTGRWTLRALD
jgi:hypothetical protein